MEQVRELLGFTIRSPADYEKLLNVVYTRAVDNDKNVLSLFERERYQLVQWFSQLRMLIREDLSSQMTRALYAVCSALGMDALGALVEEPCAVSLWLLDPFMTKELPKFDSEAELATSLAFITAICQSVILPDKFRERLDNGAIRGIGRIALYCIEADFSDALDQSIYALSAINLHYPESYNKNPILQLLIEEENIQELGISLISILNRGESNYVEPLLKLFHDIFSNSKTSNYFYTNDLKVVVDVLILESTNLPEKDELRAKYLETLYQLLMNCTDYFSILHKQDEILSLTKALASDENIPSSVHSICQKIINNCGQLLTLKMEDL